MKVFDDFIKDANSILNTLDKDYEAFQAVVTDYVKHCVTCIQKRNENLANKIKSITR